MAETLLGKIVIEGKIKCLTGLHIGASKENMEIGAVDSPVVRDPITRQPYIPGSSLKGKLRTLLEKIKAITPDREIGNNVKIHVCNNFESAKVCDVCRLFGSTGKREEKKEGTNFPSRILIRDAYLTNDSVDKLSEIDTGLQYTEWKFENAIDRVTSSANPRQLERVPKGAEFAFEFVYNLEDTETFEQDIENLKLAIRLLELDALGGHGSRGYGKVDVCIEKISIYDENSIKTKTPKKYVQTIDEVSQAVKEIFKNS